MPAATLESETTLWTPPSYDHDRVVHAALAKGKAGPADDSDNRRIARQKTAASTVSLATGRFTDPTFYWKQHNLPYDVTKDEELKRIRAWCRHLYRTHAVFGAAVDIFSQFPLVGMEIRCKDQELAEFYTELFIKQLKYNRYLVKVLRDYWLLGEAFPFGSFSELLGVWEDDELLDPDDIEVVRSPFLPDPLLRMRLPKVIRDLIQSREPLHEYERLVRAYPEFAIMNSDEKLLPVSNVLLKQIKFDLDSGNPRGVPITMRGLRTALSEEKLQAAQDATADRLYTPLILAKLGASASDLGTQRPWIPTDADLSEFEATIDAALAGDFRLLTHHFACDITSVFGRENMPRLGDDFDRMTERILMVFGLSKTMLAGACLTGDMMIRVSRAGKGFQMPVRNVVARFNGNDGGNDGHLPGRRWDPAIPTYVARADGGVVRLGLLRAAWASGVKEVFEITTAQGRSVTASATHPFLTESGEWVELGDLRVGDRLMVNTGHWARGEAQGPGYRQIWTRFHPYQHQRGMRNGKPRYSTGVHRAVMEAELNGLSYEEFLQAVQYDQIRAKELVYIDPARFHVHHIDGDKRNNDRTNLAILVAVEHLRHHASPENVLWQVGVDEIVSITSRGEQETYDLSLADEPHNFLANDFVVHNSGGQTYAADALNRDLVSQLLVGAQDLIVDFFEDRAAVVAEAQEHYDYEERGGTRYPVMEEVLEVDEETGEQRIVQQPKLLIPELIIRKANLRDEEQQRVFYEALRAAGVPISMRSRVLNVPIDLSDEREQVIQEQVEQAVAAQEARKRTYLELMARGLPIPQDLRDDFQPKISGQNGGHSMPSVTPLPGDNGQPGPGQNGVARLPDVGLDKPADDTALVPDPYADRTTTDPTLIRLPRLRITDNPGVRQRRRPIESDEMRADMPKAGRLADGPSHIGMRRYARVGQHAGQPVKEDE